MLLNSCLASTEEPEREEMVIRALKSVPLTVRGDLALSGDRLRSVSLWRCRLSSSLGLEVSRRGIHMGAPETKT